MTSNVVSTGLKKNRKLKNDKMKKSILILCVLLMAAEGYGFEEALYWYHRLEPHLGWKSLGEVLCGGVMDLGDIAGREELHQAFELGQSIS